MDVVIAQGTAILKLLAGEDEALLIRGNAFLVLDLALDVVNSIGGLDLKSDGLASNCEIMLATGGDKRQQLKLTGLDENLHDCDFNEALSM